MSEIQPKKILLLTINKTNDNEQNSTSTLNSSDKSTIVVKKVHSVGTHSYLNSFMTMKVPRGRNVTATELQMKSLSQQIINDQHFNKETGFESIIATHESADNDFYESDVNNELKLREVLFIKLKIDKKYVIMNNKDVLILDNEQNVSGQYTNVQKYGSLNPSIQNDSTNDCNCKVKYIDQTFATMNGKDVGLKKKIDKRKQIYNPHVTKVSFVDFKENENAKLIDSETENLNTKEQYRCTIKGLASSSSVGNKDHQVKNYSSTVQNSPQDNYFQEREVKNVDSMFMNDFLKMDPEMFNGDYNTECLEMESFGSNLTDSDMFSFIGEGYQPKIEKNCSLDVEKKQLDVNDNSLFDIEDNNRSDRNLSNNENARRMRKKDYCLATNDICSDNLYPALRREVSLDKLFNDGEIFQSDDIMMYEKDEDYFAEVRDTRENAFDVLSSNNNTVELGLDNNALLNVSNIYHQPPSNDILNKTDATQYTDEVSNNNNQYTVGNIEDSSKFVISFDNEEISSGKEITEKNKVDKENYHKEESHLLKDEEDGRKLKKGNSTIISKRKGTFDNGKIFPCVRCPLIFKSQRSLTIHCNRSHAGSYIYHCENCNTRYNNRNRLNRHLKRCSNCDNVPIECQICKKTYGYKSSLMQHMKRKHGYIIQSVKINTGTKLYS